MAIILKLTLNNNKQFILHYEYFNWNIKYIYSWFQT